MKTNIDKNQTSQNIIVRIAGFMFLFSFIFPTLNWAFVLSRFINSGNNAETAKNILANEILFRTGLTVELIMSAGLVILGVTLYSILKPVHSTLARMALSLKLVEAALSAAIVLFSFIALEGRTETIGLIINIHTALYAVPMVFLGLDMTLFCYLFLISKYIPGPLSVLGILSFVLIFIHSIMYLIIPEFASLAVNQAVFYGPSGLFEIIIGFRLLTKELHLNTKSVPVLSTSTL